ncbi:hypothetical protein GGS21DRAFT_486291 [Xylaria nigripes]|nr:hypothetical protein GGS21DRAFT_486291 [Xylaria nigripes]
MSSTSEVRSMACPSIRPHSASIKQLHTIVPYHGPISSSHTTAPHHRPIPLSHTSGTNKLGDSITMSSTSEVCSMACPLVLLSLGSTNSTNHPSPAQLPCSASTKFSRTGPTGDMLQGHLTAMDGTDEVRPMAQRGYVLPALTCLLLDQYGSWLRPKKIPSIH